ncbi:hypothetical protein ACWIUH_11285 [Ursidibacter arcticus]
MKIYPQLQQISESLLQQFGSPCVVKTKSEGRYNAATGEYRLGEEVSHSAYCLFDNLAYDFSKGQDTANVQQGDVLIYLTASGQPEVNSVVEANGEQWVIINCQPIKPANTVLLYQCQGRKR